MTNISLFDPMTTQLIKLFQNFGLKPTILGLNLSEDDKNYIVGAEIPDVKKEDIKVDVDRTRAFVYQK